MKIRNHLDEDLIRRLEQDRVVLGDREATAAELLLDVLDGIHGHVAGLDQVHLPAARRKLIGNLKKVIKSDIAIK